MRRFFVVLLATVLQGVLFLVPIALIAVLARETYQMLGGFFRTVTAWLPVDRVLGILIEDVLALLALVLVFLIAGLFVATSPGRRLSDRMERSVLYRVPGYLMFRGVASGFPGLRLDAQFTPVLFESDDGWAFALLVERLPEGWCTLFLPDAPSPTSGAVRIVEANRVRPLEISMLSLLGCLTRSGAGAGELASRSLPVPQGRDLGPTI
jgi:uncharacterized membrane protein